MPKRRKSPKNPQRVNANLMQPVPEEATRLLGRLVSVMGANGRSPLPPLRVVGISRAPRMARYPIICEDEATGALYHHALDWLVEL
jgi:hypothetical protein